MGRRNDGCLAMMLTYLNEESRNKKGSEFNVDDWRLTTVQDLPQQKNNYDCGVFALKYADCAARDAEFNFCQNDMPRFRRQMMVEILRSALFPSSEART